MPSPPDPGALDPTMTDPGPSDSSHPDCAVPAVESPSAPWAQRPASVVFEAPWQAQIFALVVQLNERGVFRWPEWSATLGEVIAQAPPVDGRAQSAAVGPGVAEQGSSAGEWGSSQVDAAFSAGGWEYWPAALERLLVRRGIAAPGALVALRQAWQRADESTPHGQPVKLGSGFRRLAAEDALPAERGSATGPVRARSP